MTQYTLPADKITPPKKCAARPRLQLLPCVRNRAPRSCTERIAPCTSAYRAAFHPYCVLAHHERSPEVLVEAAGEEDCVVSFRMHFVKIFMARLDLELHGLFGLQDEVEREEVAGWRLESTASCEAGGPEPPGGAGGQGGIPLLPTTLATSTRKTIRLNQVV